MFLPRLVAQGVTRRRFASARVAAPRSGVDWKSLGFSLNTKDTMMVHQKIPRGTSFTCEGNKLLPYGPVELEPSATVINYGQALFEGLKAYRTVRGDIVTFRPEMNARRLADGARRFVMPEVATDVFVDGISKAVSSNESWIPPSTSGGAFYLRPTLYGSGGALGVGPSSEYTFNVFGSPVGPYFKEGFKPIRLQVPDNADRAAPMGVGNSKCAGNYAPCFLQQRRARMSGFHDCLFLESKNREFIDEVSASNFFIVRDGIIMTPNLGTCLPGITRDSILKVAREILRIEVFEKPISLQDVDGCSEAFCTGTAAVVTPISSISIEAEGNREITMKSEDGVGDVTRALYEVITDLQYGRRDDPFGWIHPVQV